MAFRALVKKAICYSGIKPSFGLEAILGCLEFGQWLKGHQAERRLPTREHLFKYLNDDILKNAPIDYLEFGVYHGNSMRLWSKFNSDPKSRFIGFDSFQGFHEDWQGAWKTSPKDSFDLRGNLPQFTDDRISLVPGFFQDTLPTFLKEFRPRSRLVVNIDCDIYTSTLFVLATLAPILVPGTLLCFDEFNLVRHEFRAFQDFMMSFRVRYKTLATSDEFYLRAAFEMV
jgi:hypothetical protein